MSLLIEDGTGVTGAESYCSLPDALAYHAARGNDAWSTLTTIQQEQALRRATDYMAQAYRGRWKGYRSNIYQPLDWPRKSVILTDMAINYMIPFNVIPSEVKNACSELALRASTTALTVDLSRGIVSEGVGPIHTTYDRYTSQQTRYSAIDMLLRPLLTNTGAMSSLVRT